ncbi:hypothetical protein OPT61_g3551 [Boeremia exigua]|uniref:Uncharacterized protein n=1 Tax=Boeremia exigua TaxID=749465 RepID=A0ACC2IHG4_9PLEO|nr:hypothetical protein OPT61_g3551 [Boeremia exigua]
MLLAEPLSELLGNSSWPITLQWSWADCPGAEARCAWLVGQMGTVSSTQITLGALLALHPAENLREKEDRRRSKHSSARSAVCDRRLRCCRRPLRQSASGAGCPEAFVLPRRREAQQGVGARPGSALGRQAKCWANCLKQPTALVHMRAAAKSHKTERRTRSEAWKCQDWGSKWAGQATEGLSMLKTNNWV